MKKATFESSMQRLEQIVETLEEGETSLEDTVKLYEEGTKLAASCYRILEKAQQKVTQLRHEDGGI